VWLGHLDDPALGQQDEAAHVVRALDDLQLPAGPLVDLANELAGVAAIAPEPLEARQRPDQWLEHELGTVAILDISGMHLHPVDQSEGIDDNMALAPLHLLASIVTPDPPFSAVLTDWLSMLPALGCGSRPSACRTAARNVSWIRSNVPSSRQRRKYAHAVPQDTRSCGNWRHAQPVRSRYCSALTTSRRSTLRGRPPGLAAGSSSRNTSHCSSVRSVGYAFRVILDHNGPAYPFAHTFLDSGGTDNWSYFKFFHDWTSSDPVLRLNLNDDYKGSRVAWILPGYLLYSLLTPLAANVTLNAGTAALNLLLTLLLSSRLFGLAAGAVATVAVAAFPGYYSSGLQNFWSYHGVICNAFYLLLLLGLVEHARGTAPARSAALVGVAMTLTVLTSPTYLIALPSAGLFWLVMHGWPTTRTAVRRLARDLLVASLAATTVVLVLAEINHLAGGRLLFIAPLVRATLDFSRDTFWTYPAAAWLPNATWLGFPAIVAVGSGVTLLLTWLRGAPVSRQRRALLAVLLGFLGLWATMILLEARGQPFLQNAHVHYMIVGPAAVALAGVVRWLPRGATTNSPRWPMLALVALAALATIPLIALHPAAVQEADRTLRRLFLGPVTYSVSLLGGLLLGSLALTFVATSWGWRALLPAGLCLGLAWVPLSPYHYSGAFPNAALLWRLLDVLDLREASGSAPFRWVSGSSPCRFAPRRP
jgi:hypothetical protein